MSPQGLGSIWWNWLVYDFELTQGANRDTRNIWKRVET